jgi:hypothetical protein
VQSKEALAVGEVAVRHFIRDLGALCQEVNKASSQELATAGVNVESYVRNIRSDSLVVGQVRYPVDQLVGSAIFRTRDQQPDGVCGEQETLTTRPRKLVVHALEGVDENWRFEATETDVLY